MSQSPPIPRVAQGRFAKGGPGRPPGARNKLSRRIVATVLKDFEAHHLEVLRTLRRDFLTAYVTLVGRLLPRDHALDDLEDAEPLEVSPEARAVDLAAPAIAAIAEGPFEAKDLAWLTGEAPLKKSRLVQLIKRAGENSVEAPRPARETVVYSHVPIADLALK